MIKLKVNLESTLTLDLTNEEWNKLSDEEQINLITAVHDTNEWTISFKELNGQNTSES